MSTMAMPSATRSALMIAAMMVAMMLPSVAPTLVGYHRALRGLRAAHSPARTLLFAAGYGAVWAVLGLTLAIVSANLPRATWLEAAVIISAATLQLSPWKSNRVRRCRDVCVTADDATRQVTFAWRRGCRLGLECSLSCSPAMATLLVAGLMDGRMMSLITAAITAERVPPGGIRVARLTGAVALVAGLAMLPPGGTLPRDHVVHRFLAGHTPRALVAERGEIQSREQRLPGAEQRR